MSRKRRDPISSSLAFELRPFKDYCHLSEGKKKDTRLSEIEIVDMPSHIIRSTHPPPILPSLAQLLPPAAYSNSVTSVGSSLVHTSTNKIRCAVDEVLVSKKEGTSEFSLFYFRLLS